MRRTVYIGVSLVAVYGVLVALYLGNAIWFSGAHDDKLGSPLDQFVLMLSYHVISATLIAVGVVISFAILARREPHRVFTLGSLAAVVALAAAISGGTARLCSVIPLPGMADNIVGRLLIGGSIGAVLAVVNALEKQSSGVPAP